MNFSPLSASLAVMATAGFFVPAGAAEKTYAERLREISALAKLERMGSDFSAIQFSLWTYKLNAGRFPTEEQGLKALLEKPVAAPVPKRWQQVMKSLPEDPWKHPYRYVVRELEGKTEHVLVCDGPDLANKEDDREWVVPADSPPLEQSGEDKARLQLRWLSGSLRMYHVACDAFPTEEQGLAALQKKPVLEPVPKIWIQIRKRDIEADPWGRPYRYRVREKDGKKVYLLSSDGPDGADAADDIECEVKPEGLGEKK